MSSQYFAGGGPERHDGDPAGAPQPPVEPTQPLPTEPTEPGSAASASWPSYQAPPEPTQPLGDGRPDTWAAPPRSSTSANPYAGPQPTADPYGPGSSTSADPYAPSYQPYPSAPASHAGWQPTVDPYAGQAMVPAPYQPHPYASPHPYGAPYGLDQQWSDKSKTTAAVLAFFLGWLGIHNFYLSHTGRGVAQLLIWVLGIWLFFTGPIIVGIWALIEFILILTGGLRDARGRALR